MISLHAVIKTLRLYKNTTSLTVGAGVTMGSYRCLTIGEPKFERDSISELVTIMFGTASLLAGTTATIFCLILL